MRWRPGDAGWVGQHSLLDEKHDCRLRQAVCVDNREQARRSHQRRREEVRCGPRAWNDARLYRGATADRQAQCPQTLALAHLLEATRWGE